MLHKLPMWLLSCGFLLAACGGGGSSSGGNSSNTSGNTSASTASSSSVAGGTVVVSASNKTSHNPGTDCLSCHKIGGAFTAAGTIYKNSNTVNTNATVKLYVHNTNQLSANLATDKTGNIYTTEPIEGLFVAGGGLVSGVDVNVVDSVGGIHEMPGILSNGGCNGCHGVSNAAITVN